MTISSGITAEAPSASGAAPGAILPAGPQGFSAYEVAVQEGFLGTVQQWLVSLQGPPADPTALNAAVSRATVQAQNSASSASAASTAAGQAATTLANLKTQLAGAVSAVVAAMMQALQNAVSSAAGSATTAGQSAAAAGTSASNAAGSATTAGQSATAASTSADNASTSATNAAASAAQANRLAAGTNFTGASATSLAPALGTVALVLTAATAQGFAPSAFMAFVSASDWTCSMQGQFVGYDPKSGTLTLSVFALGPNTAATKADWTVVPTPPPYLPTAINGGSFTDPAPGTAVIPFTVAQSGTPTGVNGGTF